MSLNKNVDAEAAQIIGDTLYKTLIMGDQGQGGEPVTVDLPTTDLKKLKFDGWRWLGPRSIFCDQGYCHCSICEKWNNIHSPHSGCFAILPKEEGDDK